MAAAMALLSLADWLVMFPCLLARRLSSSIRATAASISTAPLAMAATAAPSWPPPTAEVIGIDRDQSAVANGAGLVEQANGRLTLVEERFSALDRVAEKFGRPAVDGVVLDLGVSSMQLDQAARGFSFRLDGPLDMRMGSDGPSAADVVAQASERDLANIIFQLGEERHSRGVARAIVAARRMLLSTPPRRWPTSSGAWSAPSRTRSIRQPGRSRRSAFSSTRSWPSLRKRSPRQSES